MLGKVQATSSADQGMGTGPDRGHAEKKVGIGNRIGSTQSPSGQKALNDTQDKQPAQVHVNGNLHFSTLTHWAGLEYSRYEKM